MSLAYSAGSVVELLRVVGKGAVAGRAHPAAQPADDRRGLVGAEVDPAALPDPVEQRRELIRSSTPCGSAPSAASRSSQDGPDRVEIRRRVDERRRDRARHRREHGRVRVLDDDGAAGLLDVPRPGRAVAAAPGQDHRGQAGPEGRGGGLEQQVDRRRDAARPRPVGGAARRRRSRRGGSTGRRRSRRPRGPRSCSTTLTGSVAWRARMSRRWLGRRGSRCWAMTIGAGKSAGRLATTRDRASMPPADEPMTTSWESVTAAACPPSAF